MSFKRKNGRQVVKGEEYYGKKLHACKVNLKRAIKKAKDLRIRVIVKDLKKQKQTGNSHSEVDLEKELQQIKSTDVEAIWTDLCNLGTEESMEDAGAFLVRSELVTEQLENMKTIRTKLEEVQNGLTEGTRDGNGSAAGEEVIKSTNKVKNSCSKQSKEDVSKKKSKKSKNRMGQRARQRLAEKLHGSAAKHKQKEIEKPRSSRREKKAKQKSESEGPLHPSWAARKQQESIKINLDSVSSKKIVFD